MPKSKLKCRYCKDYFKRETGIRLYGAFYCSKEHQIAYAMENRHKGKAKREKAERRDLKQRKEKLKTKSKWLAEAQREFNRYIRLRDERDSCISCGRSTGCKVNAGHFLSVGSHPELRFNEDNCHLQCEHCNSFLSGNQRAYRERLVLKIGLDRVEALEGPHEPLKLSIDEIKEIKAKYKVKCKELENE
jgi:hypothetical protein